MTVEEIETFESDNAPFAETFEELVLRHKKELKDLTAKITALKKTATKGDKKRKKEVQNDIAKLEAEFRKRQEEEVKQLQQRSSNTNGPSGKALNEETKNNENEEEDDNNEDIVDKLLARIEEKRVEEENKIDSKALKTTDKEVPKNKKPRQKIRKERKAAKMAESQLEAENEANNQVNLKEIEHEKITEKVVSMGLYIKEIIPDGHCLYNAISDQLQIRHNIVTDYKELRRKAAAYMRKYPDEFIPFLPTTQDGEMCSTEQFNKYCDDLENTAVWGGELEILAISKSFRIPVHIVQMNSSLLKVPEDEFQNTEPIIISFHKYMYGLGSHYNSLLNNNFEDKI
ncbi:hypothetical protein C1645_746834 [Glomus cerebriforme]|uniref:OTU domain-containing protein n=1 Tax=Glomus cerebriforme TaxID=658196 RepID=A0A397TP13_9GLOM|nr:hypothetical protein C1645_746834 [Glomus cerebriforme]